MDNHKQHQYGITRTSSGISQFQIHIARMAQVPPCSGIRRSISCFGVQPLASCVGSLELSWEILYPETRFWGCSLEWHSFIVLNRCLEISQGLTGVLSVLFCFLPQLDSWVVNPGVISWYPDCCGGRKYYRVGAHPSGLELSLWGPIFPDFN